MAYEYQWRTLKPRPIACIEAPDADAAARIGTLAQELESALERATGTAMTVTEMPHDNLISVAATNDGTTNEVLSVMLAATAVQMDERIEHDPDALVRWGCWNDKIKKAKTWVARWNGNEAFDPGDVVGRSLVSLAKARGALWLWPGEARTDDGSDPVERYGTRLDSGENILVAIVNDEGKGKDLWDSAQLDEEIEKRRPKASIARWQAIRETEENRVEYAVQAPTGCNVTEELINALAQHGCSTILTNYATATGDTSEGDAGEEPQALVRTTQEALGEASRQVNMALITSWHMHQHIDRGNPVDAPRMSVQTSEFMSSDATRQIVSIVLDHSDLMTGEEDEGEGAMVRGVTVKEEIERRRDAAKRVADSIPSARWLSHTGFSNTPQYNSVLAHNRWLDGIIGIIEDPKHRRWGNAEAISAMIDAAMNTRQTH